MMSLYDIGFTVLRDGGGGGEFGENPFFAADGGGGFTDFSGVTFDVATYDTFLTNLADYSVANPDTATWSTSVVETVQQNQITQIGPNYTSLSTASPNNVNNVQPYRSWDAAGARSEGAFSQAAVGNYSVSFNSGISVNPVDYNTYTNFTSDPAAYTVSDSGQAVNLGNYNTTTVAYNDTNTGNSGSDTYATLNQGPNNQATQSYEVATSNDTVVVKGGGSGYPSETASGNQDLGAFNNSVVVQESGASSISSENPLNVITDEAKYLARQADNFYTTSLNNLNNRVIASAVDAANTAKDILDSGVVPEGTQAYDLLTRAVEVGQDISDAAARTIRTAENTLNAIQNINRSDNESWNDLAKDKIDIWVDGYARTTTARDRALLDFFDPNLSDQLYFAGKNQDPNTVINIAPDLIRPDWTNENAQTLIGTLNQKSEIGDVDTNNIANSITDRAVADLISVQGFITEEQFAAISTEAGVQASIRANESELANVNQLGEIFERANAGGFRAGSEYIQYGDAQAGNVSGYGSDLDFEFDLFDQFSQETVGIGELTAYTDAFGYDGAVSDVGDTFIGSITLTRGGDSGGGGGGFADPEIVADTVVISTQEAADDPGLVTFLESNGVVVDTVVVETTDDTTLNSDQFVVDEYGTGGDVVVLSTDEVIDDPLIVDIFDNDGITVDTVVVETTDDTTLNNNDDPEIVNNDDTFDPNDVVVDPEDIDVDSDPETPFVDIFDDPDITSCPAPWHKILLAGGSSIEAGQLKVGMLVHTYHEDTLVEGDYPVTHVSLVKSPRLILKFDHIDFVCSPTHKFYINNIWVEAKDLIVGTSISGHNLISIADLDFGDVVKITVDQAHTYIVEGLFSHNKSPEPPVITKDPEVIVVTPPLDPTDRSLWDDPNKFYSSSVIPGDDGPATSSDPRTRIIAALYSELLGREADLGGLQFWVDSGLSINEIRQEFIKSEEFIVRNEQEKTTLDSRGGEENDPEIPQDTQVISVQQAADDPELVPALGTRGIVVDTVTVETEGNTTLGSNDNPATSSDPRTREIANLYSELLGREPDTGGLQFWVDSGLSINEIRQEFIKSEEFKTKAEQEKTTLDTNTTGTLPANAAGTTNVVDQALAALANANATAATAASTTVNSNAAGNLPADAAGVAKVSTAATEIAQADAAKSTLATTTTTTVNSNSTGTTVADATGTTQVQTTTAALASANAGSLGTLASLAATSIDPKTLYGDFSTYLFAEANQADLEPIDTEAAAVNANLSASFDQIFPTGPNGEFPYATDGTLKAGWELDENNNPVFVGIGNNITDGPAEVNGFETYQYPLGPDGSTPFDDNGNINIGWSLDEDGNPVYVGNGFIDQSLIDSANASREYAAKLLAQQQATQQAQAKLVNNGDWRIRLSLAPGSDYLYNAENPGILEPLRITNGVIFPYVPEIDTRYRADYDNYTLMHSNYKGYFYKSSYQDTVSLRATFTAQDSQEADYLLAVIHFFRSVTKMFYGLDAQRGAPPPMVFITGLGEYQFSAHPCLVSSFNYTLPNDVDYIRARSKNINGSNLLNRRSRQSLPTNPIASVLKRLESLGQPIFRGAQPEVPAPPTLGLNSPTYVPTKMTIQLELFPVQSRQQISRQFSLKSFANGNLLKGGFW